MKNRKGILDYMRKYFIEKKETNTCSVEMKYIKKIFDILLNYYDIYDLEHSSNIKVVFSCLYMDIYNHTIEEVAEITFLDKSTVKRYIKRFNLLALKLIEKARKYKHL